MIKVILVLVAVASLSANEFICDMSKESYTTDTKMLEMVVERDSGRKTKRHIEKVITDIERIIAYCRLSKEDEAIYQKARTNFIKISDTIK